MNLGLLLLKKLQDVFFRVLLLKNKNLSNTIEKISNNQYLTPVQIEELNWEKRKKLIRYAYENCPYYTQKFQDACFHPDDLIRPEDYQKVPLLTREDIQKNIESIVSKNIDRKNLILTGTGGTTGAPLMVYKQVDDTGLGMALQTRMLKWWEINPISRYATAYRIIDKNKTDSDEITKHIDKSKNPVLRMWQAFKDSIPIYLHQSIQLDPSFMNVAEMNTFINKIIKVNPVYLVGYAGAINELATYYLQRKDNNLLRLKAVWTTAAPLTSPVRQNIENAFKCPVYDQYGSIEVFWLAAECKKRRGLHFFYDVRHIEFLNDNYEPTEPNISGNVVITDLENYAFPIIRYINGDTGSFRDTICTCGVNLPLINNIQGRKSDRIYLKDGSSVSGEFLTTIFDDYAEEVQAFQIHQLSESDLKVKLIIKSPEKFEEISALVGYNLRKTTRGLIDIEFVVGNEIKHTGGKTKYVISDISDKKGQNIL